MEKLHKKAWMNEKIEYKQIGGLTRELKELHWGSGEWLDEPDVFYFERHGFKCVGTRICGWEGHKNEHLYGGYWCGYIEIPKGHPWFGKEMDQLDVDCHYGLSYAQKSDESDDWVIGFDCAHSGDISPSLQKMKEIWKNDPKNFWMCTDELKKKYPNCALFNDTYKTIDFVIDQCKSMADQAKSAME